MIMIVASLHRVICFHVLIFVCLDLCFHVFVCFFDSVSSDCESEYEEVEEPSTGVKRKEKRLYKHGMPHRSQLLTDYIRILDANKTKVKRQAQPKIQMGTNQSNSKRYLHI
jgi:hypothetical protein